MILGKKDKRFVEELKAERLDALVRLEALQEKYNALSDSYHKLGRYRTDDLELFLSGTGLDLDDFAYLCNMRTSELEKIYKGEVKMSDEEFFRLLCKVFKSMLRMSR